MALQEISDNSIQQILAFRSRFEIQSGAVAASNLEASLQEVHKLLADFISTLDVHGFTLVFDWQAFIQSYENNIDSTELIATADADTIRKIITAHIRMDRFVRGHLESLVLKGYFTSFFDRLEVLNK